MDEKNYLLTSLAEECGEVAQRCTKAIRFGLDEIQEGQTLDNADRLQQEFLDLLLIYAMLVDKGYIKTQDKMGFDTEKYLEEKEKKVLHYMEYSKEKTKWD